MCWRRSWYSSQCSPDCRGQCLACCAVESSLLSSRVWLPLTCSLLYTLRSRPSKPLPNWCCPFPGLKRKLCHGTYEMCTRGKERLAEDPQSQHPLCLRPTALLQSAQSGTPIITAAPCKCSSSPPVSGSSLQLPACLPSHLGYHSPFNPVSGEGIWEGEDLGAVIIAKSTFPSPSSLESSSG